MGPLRTSQMAFAAQQKKLKWLPQVYKTVFYAMHEVSIVSRTYKTVISCLFACFSCLFLVLIEFSSFSSFFLHFPRPLLFLSLLLFLALLLQNLVLSPCSLQCDCRPGQIVKGNFVSHFICPLLPWSAFNIYFGLILCTKFGFDKRVCILHNVNCPLAGVVYLSNVL